MANTKLTLKRGNTLSCSGPLPIGFLPDGDWGVRCMLQSTTSRRRFSLDARLVAEGGIEDGGVGAASSRAGYSLHLYASAEQTRLWPIETLVGDVEFRCDIEGETVVFSSADFFIEVIEGRTRD